MEKVGSEDLTEQRWWEEDQAGTPKDDCEGVGIRAGEGDRGPKRDMKRRNVRDGSVS